MTSQFVIHVNLNAKCPRCGKGGSVNGGVCMECMSKALKNGELDATLKPLRNMVQSEMNKNRIGGLK
ncbi:hypothetical protein DEHALATV1_0090 [Dehalococcoides mccartyi]|uniref:Uncharacterized protein n=1 Tax=Dehalococcoides mccartyi TaxID=61435 RepID=A0AB33HN64_9CHLR|nr:hypothetical protein IBK_0118 [Dehalococcoides mccartyi IBARAKI]BAZ96718.1 hypothetical protein DEHALATV1_0090 [Dehalococcoides mccartyi]